MEKQDNTGIMLVALILLGCFMVIQTSRANTSAELCQQKLEQTYTTIDKLRNFNK